MSNANTTTPIVDVMSSPDPLNESNETPVVPSTRRLTRSAVSRVQASTRSTESPRKQMFELDVGDEIAPQKILVTIEAEDRHGKGKDVTRRLFQSPTAKRRIVQRSRIATTTTIPLRGLTDDEGEGTAGRKKRGRPRKSGTPTTLKKADRAPTPMRKTPGRTRSSKLSEVQTMTSDDKVADEATPRAVRAPKRRLSSPVKTNGSMVKRRSGRPRKQLGADQDTSAAGGRESAMDPRSDDTRQHAPVDDVRPLDDDQATSDGMESDIWLADLPTPRRHQSWRVGGNCLLPSTQQSSSGLHERETAMARSPRPLSESGHAHFDGYAGGGSYEAHSDAESQASEGRDQVERQDTLAAVEEFTMISLRSLPSLQPNSSIMRAEVDQDEFGEETNLILSRTLDALRQRQKDDEKPGQTEQVAPSHGPEVILDRRRSAGAGPLASLQARQHSLDEQSVIKSVQQTRRPRGLEADGTDGTDGIHPSGNSWPAPALVLETAPSERVQQGALASEQDDQAESFPSPVKHKSTVNAPNPPSGANSLLTPEETPSLSSLSSLNSHLDQDELAGVKPSGPAVDFEMRSSPPIPSGLSWRSNESPKRRSRTRSTETPAERLSFTLPSPPAPINTQVNVAMPDVQARPTLSPIVRVGRALQLITSDPPSPPERDNALLSPFPLQGTEGKSSQSPAPSTFFAAQPLPPNDAAATLHEPERSWLAPLNQTDARALSPRPRSATSPSPVPAVLPVAIPPDMEDPFAPGSMESSLSLSHRRPLFNRFVTRPTRPPSKHGRSLASINHAPDAHPQKNFASSRLETYSPKPSTCKTAEMVSSPHLHAEGAIGLEHDPVTDVDMDAKGQPVQYDGMVEEDRVPEIEGGAQDEHLTEEEMEEAEDEEKDGNEDNKDVMEKDDDLWAIEAQRPTLASTNRPVPARESFKPPGSPWRQDRKRLVQGRHVFSDWTGHGDHSEDLSMLSQSSHQEDTVKDKKSAPAKKLDFLSSFFSPPAPLPAMQSYDPVHHLGRDETRARPTTALLPHKSIGDWLTIQSAVVQSATKAQSKAGNGPSLGHFQTRTEQVHALPQKDFFIEPRRDNSLFLPANAKSPSIERSSSPERTQARRHHFRQQHDSVPLLRRPGNPTITAASTQTRSVFHNRPPFQQDRSSPHVGSETRVLKPLPDRAASPTKSCMRSPLKPKTPGRVVEFAAAAPSPSVQSCASGRESSSVSSRLSDPNRSCESSRGDGDEIEHEALEKYEVYQGNPGGDHEDSDRENNQEMHQEGEDYKANPSGPGPIHNPRSAKVTSREALSQTQWKRDHWVRLHKLLDARRQGAPQLEYLCPHQHRTAARQTLVGKQCSADSDSMTLEEWHLDVVDAFCADVGGWTEDAIAKRVFSLLVGEERRRKGLVPRPRPTTLAADGCSM